MHIPDGLLPAPVVLGGYALTGLVSWYTLRKINRRPQPAAEMPKAALLTAAFFVASSVHIPLPPASVHFVLNGLLGVILGDYAFPALLVGLGLQVIMLGHGGLTTLGLNALILGIPALLAAHLFRLYPFLGRWLGNKWAMATLAFLAGAGGLGLAVFIFVSLMLTTLSNGWDSNMERTALLGLAVAHLPLMVLEGIFTVLLMQFIQRVQPQLLRDGS